MLLILITTLTLAAIIVSITEMTYLAKVNLDIDRDLLLINNNSKFGNAWNIGVWIWFITSTNTLFLFMINKFNDILLSFNSAVFIGSIISCVIMIFEVIIRYDENSELLGENYGI